MKWAIAMTKILTNPYVYIFLVCVKGNDKGRNWENIIHPNNQTCHGE